MTVHLLSVSMSCLNVNSVTHNGCLYCCPDASCPPLTVVQIIFCPWNCHGRLTTTHMVTYILLNLGVSHLADCTHSLPHISSGHYPTWESAVGGFGSAKDFRLLRKSIAADPSSLKPPKPLGPRPRRIPPGQYNSFGQGHAIPFPGLSSYPCIQRAPGRLRQGFPLCRACKAKPKCNKALMTHLKGTRRHGAHVRRPPNAHPPSEVCVCMRST